MFSELNGLDQDTFKAQVGLDQEDFEDEDMQELIGVYNEVKHGLDLDDEDCEEEMEEDMLEEPEEEQEPWE